MELYVWRGAYRNFGDELNDWLLPKVFPGLFDHNKEEELFLGIGSVLFNDHPTDRMKIVFGSGYGGYTAKPEIDQNWKFYCVRGPHTARAFDLPDSLVAADAAVLLNRFRTERPKTIKRAFMPHWTSIKRGNWAHACKLGGVHYLDPGRPVGELIAEIESSELVITEAMHGAIVADALRTPWIAVTPFDQTHHMKWHDWSDALEVQLSWQRLPPSSALEFAYDRDRNYVGHLSNPRGWRAPVAQTLDAFHVRRAAAGLRHLGRQLPSLSTDAAMAEAVNRLERAAEQIRRDFPQ